MKRRLFYWIYPPYLISILLSATAFTAFTARSATDFFFDLSSMELRETALLSANAIAAASTPFGPGTDGSKLQTLCDRLASRGELRLTVIDMDGRVLADTQADPESMDIHLDREEIREAVLGGYGSAVRKSASTGITTSYEAVAFPDAAGNPVAIVRVALPFSLIGSRRRELILRVLAFGVALVLAVSLLAVLLARRLAAPILRIHDGALAFASGRLDDRVPEEGPLEVANLAKLMNHMAAELEARMKTERDQKTKSRRS